jgi:hypothetical protein
MPIELTPGQEKFIRAYGQNPNNFRGYSSQTDLSIALTKLRKTKSHYVPNRDTYREKRKKVITERGLKPGMLVRAYGTYYRENPYCIIHIDTEEWQVYVRGRKNPYPPYSLVPVETPL